MANKKIIELDAASRVNSDALFPLSQLVDSDQKTLKATIAQIQSAVLAPVSGLVTLGESSGSIASFSTDIADKLFSCYVNVTAVQAGSGTPAPDNVRAISGWSACNLTGCGKNLLSVNSSTISQAGYVLNNIPVILPVGNYVLSFNFTGTGNSSSLRIDDANGNQIFTGSKTISSGTNEIAISLSQVGYAIKFYSNAVGSYTNIQIEKGTSTSAFVAYNGTTHNIPFNTTVYGGVLDVLSGVLTITFGYVDLGTLDWNYRNDGVNLSPYFYAYTESFPSGNIKYVGVWSYTLQNAISGKYPITVRNENAFIDKTITFDGGSGNTSQIQIKDSAYTDATTFKTAMSGAQLVYELATPTTIQLTPTEVKTILGQNNIFGDCGNIDLKYLETIGNRL